MIDFEKMEGLVPAIVQDSTTGEVLMLAYMNNEAFEKTKKTKRAVFWSRSRQELWEKGLTSGNTVHVDDMRIDCDGDAILIRGHVQDDGPCCHTGHRSCFYATMEE